MPKDKTGGAAFTLTEVIVAVVLMLLALGLLLSAFVSSRRSVALAQTHLAALRLARSAAEQIQTNAYTNVVSTSAAFTNVFVRYTLSNSVVSVTNVFGDKYKDIAITVEWMAPASLSRQVLNNYMTICNTN